MNTTKNTHRAQFCNGDKPGHEFHGNQYTASAHISSFPGYRKSKTDKAPGVVEDFVHTNTTTPRQAAERFVRSAKQRGADERTRLVSSDSDRAEVVVHSGIQVHRVHFIRRLDQMHNECETLVGFSNEVKVGDDGWGWIYIPNLRTLCGDYCPYSPHRAITISA